MAFINIKDPAKRKEIVQEYIDTRDVIRRKNYTTKAMDKMRDKYYGIYESDGSLKLGDAEIRLDDKNNIYIKGRKFDTSPGLWELIMMNNPTQYTNADLDEYRKINDLTDLRYNPRPTKRAYHKNTKKFEFLNNNLDGGSTSDEYMDSSDHLLSFGDGIILPGDINSLKARLQLVCAERAAGNIEATTPEIVAILDELLRRNHLSKPEYNVVCKKLGC